MQLKQKRLLIIVAIYLAGIVTGTCIGAFFVHHKITSIKNMSGLQRRNAFMGRIIEKLTLTEEQRVQIEELTTAMYSAYSSKEDEFRELNQQQKDMYDAEIFDEEAFREIYRKTAQLKEDIAVEHAIIRRKINELLTDEQKAEMDELFGRMKQKFGMRDGNGPHAKGPHAKGPHGRGQRAGYKGTGPFNQHRD